LHARLIAISGPLIGQTFPLGTERLALGRDYDNAVHLRDLSVSRHHCVLEPEGESFRLRDLDSRCGTFVNGVPVRERDLEHGDLIKVGDSLLLFQSRPEAIADDTVLLDDEPYDATATSVHRVRGESRYLLPEAILAALPEEARTARDLQALLRIGNDLHSLHATEPIARRLLELTLETIPAERATVLLLEGAPPAPAISFALGRGGSRAPFAVSRHLVERIVTEGTAVFQDALEANAEWNGVESVAGARLHSLLAALLTTSEGPLGILYLDTRDPGTRFDERHLDLLIAIAGIASPALSNAKLLAWLHEESRRMEEALDSEMVGESESMKKLSALLARIAPTDSTVLLCGESGTGKEVAARALHRNSPRSSRPFVPINCATLSETLFESELFGHERGAFTGAVEKKTGKIEVAQGGTLFLDEVGELPIGTQAKLLRVLQEREYERVGGTRTLKADVRVVAATNRDLEQAIREGTFRKDLFYRLNVFPVTLPPLRERRDDISLLADHFAARSKGRRIAGFTPEARACLRRYSWPGNVRELSNAIERALVLGEGELIRPEDLPETVLETGPAASAGPVGHYHESVNAFKRRLILDALSQADGNVTRAAERLDVNPTYLHRLISNLGLRDR